MFFYLSKVLLVLIDPTTMIVGALVVGGLLSHVSAPGWRRLGRWVFGLGLVATVAVAVLPWGRWLILPLEDRFPQMTELPAHVDGVIVAGGAINPFVAATRHQVSVNEAADRLFAFADLAHRYPGARLIYSAGSGSLENQAIKEADYAAPALELLGVPADRVIFENQSRNTYENAVDCFRIAQPQPGETWILVTSAYHMPRAVGAFRQAGWRILAYPTDYASGADAARRPVSFSINFKGGLAVVERGVHEWVGLAAYWLSGRSDALFPGPDR